MKMGCCQSNTADEEGPIGPSLYVDFEDLSFFKARCERLDVELQHLEQELQFQRDLMSALKVELHRSQLAQLRMSRELAVVRRSS